MWETVKLKDICSEFTDGDWIETKDQSAAGIRLIQTGNVKIGFFADRKDKARYISQETFRKLNCTEVLEGDILVSRLPAPVGRSCLVPRLQEKAITSVDCTVIRTNHRVLSDYLNYYMQSPRYFSLVQEKVTGATRQRISRKNLGEVLVSFPPLAEQQRIVAKLDAAFAEIDRAVEAAKRQQEHLTRLSAAVLTFQLFRKSWATKSLSDVLQTGAGGTPLKSEKHFYDGGNIPWLLSGAVCEKDITESKTHITEEGLANSSAKLFPAGTVLVAMYGATAGQVGILRTEAATNQAVCGIYPHQNFLPEFLFYYFTGYKSTLLNEVSGVAQPNLSQAKIRNVPLPVISVSDQRAVVRELDSAFSKIEALTDALSKKQNAYLSLKSAILAQELQQQQSDAA